jgi:catechol 2,3-dioxygenase-like lactoylglutathione lyase family enzyme
MFVARGLDHVNLRTAKLPEMTAFYRDIIGLRVGDRPDFGFPGAWMWVDNHAAVHLVGMDAGLHPKEPQIEHFAFRCEGLETFMQKCRDKDVPYYVAVVPGTGLKQVNVFDPDGNKVEMQFRREDGPDADLSPFKMKAPM